MRAGVKRQPLGYSMNCRVTAALLTLLVGVPCASAQGPETALTVFLTAAPVQKGDKEKQKEDERTLADASQKLKDLEKMLRAQHGNKREKWPADAQELHRQAEEVAIVANVRRMYEREDHADVTDSLEDTKRALTSA